MSNTQRKTQHRKNRNMQDRITDGLMARTFGEAVTDPTFDLEAWAKSERDNA